jgi:hypothetical protein
VHSKSSFLYISDLKNQFLYISEKNKKSIPVHFWYQDLLLVCDEDGSGNVEFPEFWEW